MGLQFSEVNPRRQLVLQSLQEKFILDQVINLTLKQLTQ